MSKTITYVITYENGRWVSRCPTGEIEGVGVAGSLSQMERDLVEMHVWAWPEDTPGVEFVFDLPGHVAGVVTEYRREKELAEAHAKRAAELAVKAAKVLTSHWSEPDTARVMGLSKQRVHQLKVSA
ncbi:hypothetical protein LDL08_26005 [Nonomuraea glycinis]|uniref:Uncharacterized protein n=1 Tax=Nonomuraea glycinis TaxID=2047744 RepID=A0A918E9K4_9ACTN|nr:hypothetical protein [Nonomuraea glycinis]MCA2179640.1 hypothetical protein [Nonomuraea glycinis]GGP15255.1 hypothetical protein GCM10012278_74270 [Nonomuraea glycinis]